jgi:hypothetical protein
MHRKYQVMSLSNALDLLCTNKLRSLEFPVQKLGTHSSKVKERKDMGLIF